MYMKIMAPWLDGHSSQLDYSVNPPSYLGAETYFFLYHVGRHSQKFPLFWFLMNRTGLSQRVLNHRFISICFSLHTACYLPATGYDKHRIQVGSMGIVWFGDGSKPLFSSIFWEEWTSPKIQSIYRVEPKGVASSSSPQFSGVELLGVLSV